MAFEKQYEAFCGAEPSSYGLKPEFWQLEI
jgi:hypothetical protein